MSPDLTELIQGTKESAPAEVVNTSDDRWDSFLEDCTEGQFQQSSLWAHSKSPEGWSHMRLTLEQGGRIISGFQILMRNSRFGRIGYVSKGPALSSPDPVLHLRTLRRLQALSKKARLRALIVQPPDNSRITVADLSDLGFAPNRLVNVISATLVVNLECTFEQVQARMRSTTLKQVRRAQRRGVAIREGGESDIGTFFELMATTCARQQTRPAPASQAALLEIWRQFQRRGAVRLSIAEVEGKPVAGLFSIKFGDRFSAWKKGWSGEHGDCYPNVLTSFEAVQWAHTQGYRMLDFMGFDRAAAESFERGGDLTAIQPDSLYWFNLGFGSTPVVLPESWVYFPNAALNAVYRYSAIQPWFRSIAKRFPQV